MVVVVVVVVEQRESQNTSVIDFSVGAEYKVIGGMLSKSLKT